MMSWNVEMWKNEPMQSAASRTSCRHKSSSSLFGSLDNVIKQIGWYEVPEEHEILMIKTLLQWDSTSL